MQKKPKQLTDLLLMVTLALLGITTLVVTILVLSGNTPGPSQEDIDAHSFKEQVWDLNARYVFVYPYPSELPDSVNLCVNMITLGEEGRDTVWLMPDHESAGY